MIQVNKRTVIMKITKIFIEKSLLGNESYTEKELAKTFYIRKRELAEYTDTLFNVKDEEYILKDDTVNIIQEYIKKHNESKRGIKEVEKKYKVYFEEIKETYRFLEIYEDLKPLINQLHWAYLPIYSDIMIRNRDINPEKNIDDYYYHFHSLKDLYEIIIGDKDDWKTLKGDLNLNYEYKFPVYTNRWGHDDIYKVTRTYNGWHVGNIGISGSCTPDGKNFEGTRSGFIANFNQDYVEYPKSFHYILEYLWELADESEMSTSELQEKLLDISKLVCEVEKTIGRCKPNWY